MIEGVTQTNAAKILMVGHPAKEVITLGGNPHPALTHLPRPSSPRVTVGSLTEVFGQVGQPTDVLHHFSNPLISLVPWGTKIDIKISNEEGGMPFWTLVEGLFDMW